MPARMMVYLKPLRLGFCSLASISWKMSAMRFCGLGGG
jgi:hypothetical protein